MSFPGKPIGNFTWSYSVLKNYETCPKRYFHYNLQKDVVEPTTSQQQSGFDLHSHFEKRVKSNTPLPLGYTHHEPLIAKFIGFPGETYAEQKLGLTSSFTPIGFFGKGVWFRAVLDFTKINNDFALVVDWKDGKPKQQDITQLQLFAATIFHHLPAVQRVRAALVFVSHDHVEKAEFVRGDVTEIWSEILPRVKKIEKARQDMEFPPKPSGLCKKYCAVVSCPFHGRGG